MVDELENEAQLRERAQATNLMYEVAFGKPLTEDPEGYLKFTENPEKFDQDLRASLGQEEVEGIEARVRGRKRVIEIENQLQTLGNAEKTLTGVARGALSIAAGGVGGKILAPVARAAGPAIAEAAGPITSGASNILGRIGSALSTTAGKQAAEKAGTFVGQTVGASAGDVAGSVAAPAAIEAVQTPLVNSLIDEARVIDPAFTDPRPKVAEEDLLQTFADNIIIDAGISVGAGRLKAVGDWFSGIVGKSDILTTGAKARRTMGDRALEHYEKIYKSTDADILANDLIKLGDADFKLKHNADVLSDAYEDLSDVFKKAEVGSDGKIFQEKVFFGGTGQAREDFGMDPVSIFYEGKLKNVNALQRVAAEAEREAKSLGLDLSTSVAEFFGPVAGRLADPQLNTAVRGSLLRQYKKEINDVVKQVLPSTQHNLYARTNKKITSMKLPSKEVVPGAGATLLDSDLDQMSFHLKDAAGRTVNKMTKKKISGQLVQISEAKALRDRVVNSKLSLETQIQKKRQWGDLAYANDRVRQVGVDRKAAQNAEMFKIFEGNARNTIESSLKDMPEFFEEYKRRNWKHQQYVTVEPPLLNLRAKALRPTQGDTAEGLKIVSTAQSGSTGGVRLFTGSGRNIAADVETQLQEAVEIWQNPRVFRRLTSGMGLSTVKFLQKNSDKLYAPQTIQMFRSMLSTVEDEENAVAFSQGRDPQAVPIPTEDGLAAPVSPLSEEAKETLKLTLGLLEEGAKGSEETKRAVAMQLLSNPQTAPIFEQDAAADNNTHLKNLNTLFDGVIEDPEEIQKVRESILRDKDIMTNGARRFIILNKLNGVNGVPGDISGFEVEPPAPPLQGLVQEAKRRANDRVLKLVEKKKAADVTAKELIDIEDNDTLVRNQRR